MTVAQSQDAFKRSTLKAMAAGDPYGDANDEVASVETEALKGQASDAQGAGAPGRIADKIAGPITGSSDAVQSYLGEMQGAQAAHDQAFATAAAGYAPPPIYDLSNGVSGADGYGGLSPDDLATKAMIFPNEFGGGFRYGGFRTQAEGNAAVLGSANMEARALAEQQAMLAQAHADAQAKAATARQAFNPTTGGGVRRPVVSHGGINAAEEGKQTRQTFEQAHMEGPRGARQVSDEGREGGRAAEAATVADLRRAATPARPVVSRGLRMLEGERNDFATHNPAGVASRLADQDARQFAQVMPEEWELQRQAALDWGYNPYIAEGIYDEPTPRERNTAISSENEYNERLMDPEGMTMRERAAAEQAFNDATYPGVSDEAAKYGMAPQEYDALLADPTFMQAAEQAGEVWGATSGNLDQVQLMLIDEWGLSPVEVAIIMDTFEGAGINPNSSSADPNYQYGP